MCINCNIPLPLKDHVAACLGLPNIKELCVDDNELSYLLSIRDLINLILRFITQKEDTISIPLGDKWKFQLAPFLSHGLGIKLFCITENVDSIEDIRKLLGLSDFSYVYKQNLQVLNFTNVHQKEFMWRFELEFPNSPSLFKIAIGKISDKPNPDPPRQMPEGYPLQQLCFQTILSIPAFQFYGEEETVEQKWRLIERIQVEHSKDEIWNAIRNAGGQYQFVSGTVVIGDKSWRSMMQHFGSYIILRLGEIGHEIIDWVRLFWNR